MKNILIVVILFLSGCVHLPIDNLLGYDLYDFEKYQAPCNTSYQCKVIGYGRSTSCSANNYVGYIIYSTKMGQENIDHLNRLVSQSLGFAKPKNDSPLYASVTLEECTLAEPLEPRAICIDHKCERIYEN